jgi:copper(I)-binding protein
MDNGIASMTTATEGVEVPPQGSLTLKPGGTHIMLVGTRADLKVGDVLPLRLTLRRAGSVDIAVPILPLGAPDPFAEK